jgi:hypothetical protein
VTKKYPLGVENEHQYFQKNPQRIAKNSAKVLIPLQLQNLVGL